MLVNIKETLFSCGKKLERKAPKYSYTLSFWQVLQRNYDVRKAEERRIMQLSVRLQLNRLTDDEYSTIRR